MWTDNTRLLYEEELIKINRVIGKLYGVKNTVESGSYSKSNEGNTCINFTLCESNLYKSKDEMKNIAEAIKNIMGVDDVYCLGIKLL